MNTEVKTERNNTPIKNQPIALRNVQSRDDDFMDIGLDTGSTFKKQKSKNIKEDKWYEEEDRGL